MFNRNEYILQDINLNGIGLEIGPSFNPICPKKLGYRIETIDHIDKDGLINKYKDDPNVGENIKKIEDVDYVWNGEPYSQLTGKTEYYDYILASHLIEHSVDIIEYLSECSGLLKPDGILSMAIPDKRYTFDYFKEATSIRTVIDNHIYREHYNHSLGTVLDNYLNIVVADTGGTYIPNSAYLMEEHLLYEKSVEGIQDIINKYNEKEYVDCHSWIFTPASFALMIYELNTLNYIDLYIDDIYKVPQSKEFLVKMKKGRIKLDSQRLLQLQIKNRQEYKEANCYDILLTEWSKCKKIYIYGTGLYTQKIMPVINSLNINIEGLVISDGQSMDKQSSFGKPVYYLSDLNSKKDDTGIIISVGDRYYDTIRQSLKDKGFQFFV